MAHLHEMRDSDSHFVIDPITRTASNPGSAKNMLIQYDHKSEIFTFELPRYVDGHDMLLCNRAEIHYINVDAGTRRQKFGVYEISDFAISEDDEEVIVWSWPISSNATQYVGQLSFAFRFACLTDDVVDYAWSTAPYKGITISDGIYNGEMVEEEYIDILQQWVNKIGVGIDDINQDVVAYESEGVNLISMTLTDGRVEYFEIRNGRTPVRGEDYWTDNDKTEIINSILDVIPVAEEASF